MNVGVFAWQNNKQARQLHNILNAFIPGSAIQYDLALDQPDQCSMDAAGIEWNRLALSPAVPSLAESQSIAFLHGFSYCDPVIPPCDSATDVDWSLWRFDYIASQQKYSFLYSVFSELQRRGVKIVNAPDAQLSVFMKPFLLEQLRQAKFNVPSTLCTNNMGIAKEFCASAGRVFWRPATGRAAWQMFLKRQREALISNKKPPVLLAEGVEGPFMAGYYFEGKLLLLLERKSPCLVPEETLESFRIVDQKTAPPELARICGVLKIPWLQVLFVLKDGKAWIYDIDADPLFEGLPAVYSEILSARLAAALLNMDATAMKESLQSKETGQRPTLFLRRMLQILFEFEQSKYA